MKIAVQGCCHGALNKIYSQLPPVDLLLICGDFQAIRNERDFDTMSVPKKYQVLGDFHQYYSGELRAPVLTIFIGGNHEASSYLKELKFGGWAAPNIYYLGDYGSVWYRGIHITGWSGIYNQSTFLENRLDDEPLPYTAKTLRSVYHSKPKNYLKMLLSKTPDIVLSHDWPQSIEQHGDTKRLLRDKKWFRADVESDTLGSPLNKEILRRLKPPMWFSAHLHVCFEAQVAHGAHNEDEIDMDMDDDKYQSTTSFLALDKCLPKRKHLRVIDVKPHSHVSAKNPNKLYYDSQAVAINRVVEDFCLSGRFNMDMREVLEDPSKLPIEELREEVERVERTIEGLEVPLNFARTAPSVPSVPVLRWWVNPQLVEYCRRFNVVCDVCERSEQTKQTEQTEQNENKQNGNEQTEQNENKQNGNDQNENDQKEQNENGQNQNEQNGNVHSDQTQNVHTEHQTKRSRDNGSKRKSSERGKSVKERKSAARKRERE